MQVWLPGTPADGKDRPPQPNSLRLSSSKPPSYSQATHPVCWDHHGTQNLQTKQKQGNRISMYVGANWEAQKCTQLPRVPPALCVSYVCGYTAAVLLTIIFGATFCLHTANNCKSVHSVSNIYEINKKRKKQSIMCQENTERKVLAGV